MKSFKSAFVRTIPIMLSYLFLGIVFGMLVHAAGLAWFWAPLISLTLYTGAFQFVLMSLLANQADIGTIAITAVLINSRNLFYGFPFIQFFKSMGLKMPFMIHAMSDETFALLTSAVVEDPQEKRAHYFWIALLDFAYWAIGSAIGALLGSVLRFDLAGIEFCMTALFLTIFLDQWKQNENRRPALIGFGSALFFLVVVGPRYFLLPTLILTAILLLATRKREVNA